MFCRKVEGSIRGVQKAGGIEGGLVRIGVQVRRRGSV